MNGIAFFDISSVNIDRFYTNILDTSCVPSVIFIETPEEADLYKAKGFYKDKPIFCIAGLSDNEITTLFDQHGITSLLIDAQRIPDLYITLLAKKSLIKVIYLQHGMYIPFMKRNLSFFLTQAFKVMRFAKYAFKCAQLTREYSLFFILIKIHIFGMSRRLYSHIHPLFPDVALVFSDYWKKWHIEHYAFNEESEFCIIGSPDFAKFSFTEKYNHKAVSYCYQTLVEDGRISEKDMVDFYHKLFLWIKQNNLTLVVKGHPRMNNKFYEIFLKQGVKIVSDKIPNTDVVIGHYSSLLPYWGMHGRCVVTVNLPGHPIHESIASWSHVIDNFDGLDFKLCKVDLSQCQYYYGKLHNKKVRCVY
jgi:hypothetical protein